jgi:hypothetical protein
MEAQLNDLSARTEWQSQRSPTRLTQQDHTCSRGALDGEAESITRKAIELAKSGDGPALRLCLDRIAPARKDRPVVFDMPQLKTAGDAVNASSAIVSAVASGELTPGEASEVAKAVNVFTQAVSNADIEQRLEKLEQMLKVKR